MSEEIDDQLHIADGDVRVPRREPISKDHCRHYLPHIEGKKIQMLTFRLADSLPKSVINEWKAIIKERTEEEKTFDQKRKLLILIDKYEDAGYGECLLSDAKVADIVKNALFYKDKVLYDLQSWCIMPNHVHVLIKVQRGVTISEIMFGWRSFSAHAINKLLKRKGEIWMPEYFDRYIRDEEHFAKVKRYIHNNPVKAGLVKEAYQWRWSSAYDGAVADEDVHVPDREDMSVIADGDVRVPPK